MANIIRIKRRAQGGAAGSPSSLKNAELAFNEQDYTLYYGYGASGNADATQIISIGGAGAFVTLNTDQTISGNKIFSGAVTANNLYVSGITVPDDSIALGTKTTGNYIATITASAGNNISVTGSGVESAAITLDLTSTGVSAGSYGSTTQIPTFTVDAYGRLTSASTANVATSLSIAGNAGTDTVNLLSDTLTVSGASHLTSTVTNNKITLTTDATNLNLADTIISRDSVGDFAAGIASLTTLKIGALSYSPLNALVSVQSSVGSYNQLIFQNSNAGVNASSDIIVNNNLSTDSTYYGDFGMNSSTWNGIGGFNSPSNVYLSSTSADLAIGTTTANAIRFVIGGSDTDALTISSASIATFNGTATKLTSILGNVGDLYVRSATGGDTSVILTPSGAGTVDVSGYRITNVADPTQSQDAATKAYVDAVKTGLDVKDSVRVASISTSPITAATYSNGASGVGATLTNNGTKAALSIDGISLAVGDRVLVKDAVSGSWNGIYTVTTSGTGADNWVLTRSTDADGTPSNEVSPGMFTFVEEGDTNADSGWVLTTNGTIALGTTSLSFAQFSGAGQITAGAGLTKIGNTIDVGAGYGITVNANDIQLATSVAGSGLTYTTGVLDVIGTADRITSNANSIDIASTYIGQSSITTLGTITTGIWSGTTVAVSAGGTGATTFTSNGIIYGNTQGALQVTSAGTYADDGSQFLTVGVGGVPTWTFTIDGGSF